MPKQLPIILMVVLFIGSMIFEVVTKKKIDEYSTSIIRLLAEGKYAEFEKEINSDKAKRLIPPANIDILKFNVAIMRGQNKEVEKIFDSFATKRLSNDAKLAIYTRALGYFITTNDINRCKKCYEVVMGLPKNEQAKKSVQRVYDIMVEKKTDKLDELLNELDKVQNEQKYIDEFLISEIYTNLKDTENANKYAELAKTHLMSEQAPDTQK